MLNDMLQRLYTAIKTNDNKTRDELVKGLNKIGMDNCTINVLLKELIINGTIK